MFHRLITENR